MTTKERYNITFLFFDLHDAVARPHRFYGRFTKLERHLVFQHSTLKPIKK